MTGGVPGQGAPAKHPRITIRDRFIQILKNRTDANDRVFPNKKTPVWEPDLMPQIIVNTQNESIDLFNESPRELKRNCQFRVDIFAMDANGKSVDEILDKISLQVEQILSIDDTLGFRGQETTGFNFHDCVLSNVQTVFENDGEKPIACMQLTYSVVYHTLDGLGEGTLAGILPVPFEGFDFDVYLQPPDPENTKDMEITVDVDPV